MNEYECHGDENKCVFRYVLKVGRLSRDRMAGGRRLHVCECSVTEMSLESPGHEGRPVLMNAVGCVPRDPAVSTAELR